MTKYYERKAHARQISIDWQLNFNNQTRHWNYCIQWAARFERIGKKYGLLKEFKENGIL